MSVWDSFFPVGGAVAGAAAGSFFGMPSVGASIGGAIGGALGNSLGSSEAIKGQREAAAARAAAIQQEQAQLGQIVEQNAPGQAYEQRVVAGSASLTPEQQQQLEDQRRAVGNQIRGSSIAGSGRTAASLLRDTENRFTLGALGQNRARADTAAGAMAGRGFQAGVASAKANEGIGKAYGDAAENSGLIQGMSTMATGKQVASAFGDISANITRSNKLRQIGSEGPTNLGGGGSGSSYRDYSSGSSGGTGGGLGALY